MRRAARVELCDERHDGSGPHRHHALAKKRRLEPKDLVREPLIALSRRFPLRTKVDATFAAIRSEPNVVTEATTSAFLVQMVRNGLGIAVLNPFPVELNCDEGLVLRPFELDIILETAIVVPAFRSLKPAARAIANFIRAHQPETSLSTAAR